ncbi:MAG: hypothetical protein ACREQM_23760 [Candidatus Dormibacteraceae bacterium]
MPGCQCGFWALNDPFRTFRCARAEHAERYSVVGLIRGWGEVAFDGDEAFRAEYAGIVCLFADWCWQPDLRRARSSLAGPRFWLRRRVGDVRPATSECGGRQEALRVAARAYGVPLLSLRSAAQGDLLGELGIGGATRSQLGAILGAILGEPVGGRRRWVSAGHVGRRTGQSPSGGVWENAWRTRR